jgi:hypothetical protein
VVDILTYFYIGIKPTTPFWTAGSIPRRGETDVVHWKTTDSAYNFRENPLGLDIILSRTPVDHGLRESCLTAHFDHSSDRILLRMANCQELHLFICISGKNLTDENNTFDNRIARILDSERENIYDEQMLLSVTNSSIINMSI